jgi:hypothetical protein
MVVLPASSMSAASTGACLAVLPACNMSRVCTAGKGFAELMSLARGRAQAVRQSSSLKFAAAEVQRAKAHHLGGARSHGFLL